MLKYLFILLFIISITSCTNQADQNKAVDHLEKWLSKAAAERMPLDSLSFATEVLTKEEAEQVKELLYHDHQSILLKQFANQWKDSLLKLDTLQMPFYYQIFGEEPKNGRSLIFSLHGGGSAPAEVNDQQYENQQHLYDSMMNSQEGIYFVPRAPTNAWNMWFQEHIDDFFTIVIQLAVQFENVNPNKIYLMGYSAGGDGVYQLAPRFADRLAGAAMMAGHPNETSPLGLRNLPFALHMGGLDDAHNRNGTARQWKQMLDSLASIDTAAYLHQVKIHGNHAHWMHLDDAIAIPWIKQYERNPIPEKVVWLQDDRHHTHFYWLGTPQSLIKTAGKISVEYSRETNEINIIENYSDTLIIYLNDDMLNLDQAISIKYKGQLIKQASFHRNILSIYKSIHLKGDKQLSFSSSATIVKNEQLLQE